MSPNNHFEGLHSVNFNNEANRPSISAESLSDESLAVLSGCTADGTVNCSIDHGVFVMEVKGQYISGKNTVCIKRDKNGLYLYLDYIRFEDTAPDGLGTVMLSRMAHEAKRLGLTHIRLLAAGGTNLKYCWGEGDFAGYYVWPRLGFDAELKPVMLEQVNREQKLKGSSRVRDIMNIDRAWWKENGSGDYMEFDLSDNSYSWKTLNDFLAHRGWSL